MNKEKPSNRSSKFFFLLIIISGCCDKAFPSTIVDMSVVLQCNKIYETDNVIYTPWYHKEKTLTKPRDRKSSKFCALSSESWAPGTRLSLASRYDAP